MSTREDYKVNSDSVEGIVITLGDEQVAQLTPRVIMESPMFPNFEMWIESAIRLHMVTSSRCEGSNKLVTNDEHPTCPCCNKVVNAEKVVGGIYRISNHNK